MAFSFTGNTSTATNYITSPDNADWEFVAPCTFSIWARKLDVGEIEYYVAKGLETGKGYRIRSNQYRGFMLNLGDSGGAELILTTDFEVANGWVNFAFTLDGSGNLKGYRNGVEDGSDTGLSTDWSSTRQVCIGTLSGWNAAPLASADNNMAEFARWNRVLSAGELASLAFVSPSMIPNGLTAHVPGLGAAEYESRGLALTETGTVGFTDHPPIILPSAQILHFPPAAAGGGGGIIPQIMHHRRLTGAN